MRSWAGVGVLLGFAQLDMGWAIVSSSLPTGFVSVFNRPPGSYYRKRQLLLSGVIKIYSPKLNHGPFAVLFLVF